MHAEQRTPAECDALGSGLARALNHKPAAARLGSAQQRGRLSPAAPRSASGGARAAAAMGCTACGARAKALANHLRPYDRVTVDQARLTVQVRGRCDSSTPASAPPHAHCNLHRAPRRRRRRWRWAACSR